MEKNIKRTITRKISSVMPLLCVTAFLTIGFVWDAWHPGWAVFALIPLTEIILSLCYKRGKELIMALTVILATITYLFLGFYLGAWHPGWLVFFSIPILAVIVY